MQVTVKWTKLKFKVTNNTICYPYLSLISILHCSTYSQISCRSANTQVSEPPTFEWTFNSPRLIGKWTLYWPCGSKSKISSPKTVSRFGYSQSSDFSTTTSGVDRRLNADICWGGVAYLRLPSDCRHDWSVCETCKRHSSNSWSSSLLWKKTVLLSSDQFVDLGKLIDLLLWYWVEGMDLNKCVRPVFFCEPRHVKFDGDLNQMHVQYEDWMTQDEWW